MVNALKNVISNVRTILKVKEMRTRIGRVQMDVGIRSNLSNPCLSLDVNTPPCRSFFYNLITTPP